MSTPRDMELDALGMRDQPGIATGWPDIVPALNALYNDRIGQLPFVPSDWASRVVALNGVNGNAVLIQPALKLNGLPNAPLPDWLDTDEKRQAWQGAWKIVQDAYLKFAQGKAKEGRAALDAAYADAAFWNGLYTVAVAIRDAPSTVANGAASFVTSNLFNFSWKFWLVAGVVGIGAFVYFAPRIATAKKLVGK